MEYSLPVSTGARIIKTTKKCENYSRKIRGPFYRTPCIMQLMFVCPSNWGKNPANRDENGRGTIGYGSGMGL